MDGCIMHEYLVIPFLSLSFTFSYVLLYENFGHASTLFFTLIKHMLQHENFSHVFTYSPRSKLEW